MSQCYNPGDSKKYFRENMEALGLPFPDTYFETFEKAIGYAALMLGAVKAAGKGATVSQAFLNVPTLQLLANITAGVAAGYTGAVIGSIMVASGRSISCGRHTVDAFEFIHGDLQRFLRETGLFFDKWFFFYLFNEEIFNVGIPARSSFRKKVETHDFDYSRW